MLKHANTKLMDSLLMNGCDKEGLNNNTPV